MDARFDYLLRLGDDALILGQQLGLWTGHGPVLEEDIALTNIGQGRGQARLLPRPSRLPQRPALRAAQRPFRGHHRPPVPL
jgi:hypothetical protein